ncbi:hypothetical protein [Hymenobacter psychrotolerans]|uniref:Phage abortive infection protein n=1 Tax=Hymenobacter psychrotolerans DSM 18569 TaxID=1121959 RepID=A0A1M6UPZ2_9BACT|nr:hypothetical protein [Hymenobacter psychrotolerans]SHK71230.1 hypothetical protein SAMN02746009_01438 [Hymenobacter psychrotolerans DSM 18569]
MKSTESQQNPRKKEGIMDHVKKIITSPVGATLLIGSFISLLLPIVLTQLSTGIDFSNTGQIGDTIGGIAGPFLNLTGLIIVYFSFKQQLEANNKQWESLELENVKERQQNDFDIIYKSIVMLGNEISIHEPSFRSINQIIKQVHQWNQTPEELIPGTWELMKNLGFEWNGIRIEKLDDYWKMLENFDWLSQYIRERYENIIDSIKRSDMDETRKNLLHSYLRNMCILPPYNWLPEESMQQMWDQDESKFQDTKILSLINELRVHTPMIFPHVIYPFISQDK